MMTLTTGVKIPTDISDCVHMKCADCGYKESALKPLDCKQCLHDLRYLSQDCRECTKSTNYDYHMCNHRTKFLVTFFSTTHDTKNF